MGLLRARANTMFNSRMESQISTLTAAKGGIGLVDDVVPTRDDEVTSTFKENGSATAPSSATGRAPLRLLYLR